MKYLEIRDRATCIAAIGIAIDGNDSWLAHRAGFAPGERYILLSIIAEPNRTEYDPHAWSGGARTLPVAHQWIIANWDSLENESVVCVEFITGERETPKESDRFYRG